MKLHPIPSCHSLNQENLALVPQQYALQLEETTLLRKKAADILDSFEEPNKAPSLNLNSNISDISIFSNFIFIFTGVDNVFSDNFASSLSTNII